MLPSIVWNTGTLALYIEIVIVTSAWEHAS
jgi:hypothetical protein